MQLVQGLILFQGKTFPKLLVNVEHTVLESLLVTWANYSAKFHTMGERRPQWQEGPSCQMDEVRRKTQCWHGEKNKELLEILQRMQKTPQLFHYLVMIKDALNLLCLRKLGIETEWVSIFFMIHVFIIIFFYFTILYWFCHTSTLIHHGCIRVSHPESPSHLPPRTIQNEYLLTF